MGGGIFCWRSSGAAADMPLTNPCIRILDCWNSWAIVPRSDWRWVVWWTMVATVVSSLRSVCVLMAVERVPNFSSILSLNSFIIFERCFSVTNGLEWATLFIAWILSAMASLAGA